MRNFARSPDPLTGTFSGDSYEVRIPNFEDAGVVGSGDDKTAPSRLSWLRGAVGPRTRARSSSSFGLIHEFGSTISRTSGVRRSSSPGCGQRAEHQSLRGCRHRLDPAARALENGPPRGRKDCTGLRRCAENVPDGDTFGTGAPAVRHVGPCLQAQGKSARSVHAVRRRPARTCHRSRKGVTQRKSRSVTAPEVMNPFRSSLV